MMHGIYRIMAIPETEWKSLDESFAEIAINNLMADLAKNLTSEQIQELNTVLLNDQDNYLKVLTDWLSKNNIDHQKELSENIKLSYINSSTDFINAFTKEANSDQKRQVTEYLTKHTNV